MFLSTVRSSFVIFIICILASCNGSHGSSSNITLKPASFKDLKNFDDQHFQAIVKDYQNVCTIIHKHDSAKIVRSNTVSLGKAANLKKICSDFETLISSSNEEIIEYFKANFSPYLVIDNTKSSSVGLFTGYYYPIINVGATKHGDFIHPIYKRPHDLIPNKPYYTRREIYDGAISDKNLELFWTNDMLDLFTLQIQGSGIAKFEDGKMIHVAYDGKNNRPYRSVGQYMIQKNISSGKTHKEIDAWLRANPDQMKDILSINESYIFFKVNPNHNVIGAHGSNLVPARSLAVDSRYIPYGAMLYLNTDTSGSGIVFAQDTGSAITGPIRGDVFYGSGDAAYHMAEKMKDRGSYHILIPKEK